MCLSTTEDRLILLGRSARLWLLVVLHCCREADAIIRVISARKASRDERAIYEVRFWSCSRRLLW